MTDDRWTVAAKEALAVAPSDEVVLETLELIHPAFVDDEGAQTAIRVVRGYAHTATWLELAPAAVQPVLDALSAEARAEVGLVARLEDAAPLDGGDYVAWTALAFDLDLPMIDRHRLPEIDVKLDNVGRTLIRHLDAASQSQEHIEVRYRPYLSTDISGPQMDPPLQVELFEVEVDVLQVQGRARIFDFGSRRFPDALYTARDYPGLAR